jgi:cytochrome c-type biogenesis protein CcmH/NrfG
MMSMRFLYRLRLVIVLTGFSGPLSLSQPSQIAQSVQNSKAPQTRIDPITVALRAHQFQAAADLSRAALKEFPNDAQLWALQGMALANEGKGPDALAAFQQALKISPNHIMALQGAAQLKFRQSELWREVDFALPGSGIPIRLV